MYLTECKVDGCSRNIDYLKQGVCQMHYFRFMRNGYYHLKRKKDIKKYDKGGCRYRIQSPNGYQKIYSPNHPLVTENQLYVFEHRVVYYDEINSNPDKCDLCGESIDWTNLHIDHKDDDRTNNNPENLRALCRPCNTFRGHTSESMGKDIFEIRERKMTAFAWARQPGVVVSGSTILRRRRNLNMNDYDCIHAPRITHHKTVTKTGKAKKKFDDIRGI